MWLKKVVLPFLFLNICLFSLSGCSKNNVEKWNASCMAKLENLPSEFYELKPEVQEEISIYIHLRNPKDDKKSTIQLSKANDFSNIIYLKPSVYEITSIYVSHQSMAMIEAATSLTQIEIKKNSQAFLPIQLTNAEAFVESIRLNQATPEILTAMPFSRKIQYNGEIIDLNNITQIMQFTVKPVNSPTFTISKSTDLKPAEKGYISSSSHSGVTLVVQNQTNTTQKLEQATPIGVKFYNSNAVFPKGIQIGMPLIELVHNEKGIMGTPNYCTGSPLFELDGPTMVYLDDESGDRISFNITSKSHLVSSITYEFEQFE